jgi:hypothetical protein
MWTKLVVTSSVALSLLAVSASGITSVAALSCVPHPDASPTAIAAGEERLSTADDFFDRYDVAVIGTVTEIRTVDRGGDAGATTIGVDVLAMLGQDTAPPQFDISASDPGWMSGYPYEVGVTYFVPIQGTGPDGQPNYSFACDPVTVVDPSIVPELRRLAARAGIAFSTPTGGPRSTTVGSGDVDVVGGNTSSPSTIPTPAIVLVVGGAVLVVGALAVRSRRRPSPRGS